MSIKYRDCYFRVEITWVIRLENQVVSNKGEHLRVFASKLNNRLRPISVVDLKKGVKSNTFGISSFLEIS